MLKIGEFSSLTGISIHMLRNYDKIGLLKPELVESENNYRFYGEKQLVRANQIQVLKSLGFSLNEIIDILTNGTQDIRMKASLENKINEKEASLAATIRQLEQLRQAMKELDTHNDYSLSVSIKKLPARKVVSLRGVIKEFNEEGLLWERLNRACQAHGIKLTDLPYCMAMTHYVDFEKKIFDTEVFRFVDHNGVETDEVKFNEFPSMEVAVVAFQGTYHKIGDVNRYIYHWIDENGYRISGKPFNIYYISPNNEINPENFVTEICYPIKK